MKLLPGHARPVSPRPPSGWSVAVRRRALPAALAVVFAVAVAIAWLGDPRAGSYSDSGARIATVKTMAEQGTWVADVGYWAAAADPTGQHHPLLYARPVGAHWQVVKSLPLSWLGRPLWDIGGARAVMLIPALGVVLAAWGAYRLGRWSHGGSGWSALWMVGLASPCLFYAADFWEHAPAVGAALLALSFVLDWGWRATWARALGTGALAGIAVVLRTEVAFLFIGVGLVLLTNRNERARMLAHRIWVAIAVATAAVMYSLNLVLERSLMGASTVASRAASQLPQTGSALGQRLRDIVLTSVGLFPNEDGLGLVVGLTAGLAIILLAWAATHGDLSRGARAFAIAVVVLIFGWRLLLGLSAVPGFLAVAPVAALAFTGLFQSRQRILVFGAALALPGIWATEWVGQHAPQWGGRYVLASTAVFLIVAASVVEHLGLRKPIVAGLVGLTVVMAGFGVVWHIDRTRSIAATMDTLRSEPSDVVMVTDWPHVGNEGGAWYGEHRMLDANPVDGVEDLAGTVAIARQMGATRVDVMTLRSGHHPDDLGGPAPAYPGYAPVRAWTVPWLWDELLVWRYEAV